jgi:spore germination protein YaaH
LKSFRKNNLGHLCRSIITVAALSLSSLAYAQEQPQISITPDTVLAKVKKEKPEGWLAKILFALSPKKYTTNTDYVYRIDTIKNAADPRWIDIMRNASVSEPYIEGEWAKRKKYTTEKEWDDSMKTNYVRPNQISSTLTRTVYGYNPYWTGTAYKSFNYKLLSRIAYFSYALNPLTGSYQTIQNWKTTEMIDLAHQNGCKVDLCVTNFGNDNNRRFLTNPRAQKAMIDSVISLLALRKADGVNINFEDIPADQKDNFTNFIINLSSSLNLVTPEYKLTLAVPKVDWNMVFDIPALTKYVTFFIINGYDFYGENSLVAGPNSLLFSGNIWNSFNLDNSVKYYLSQGVANQSLLLGLPYYGKEWITSEGLVPSRSRSFIGAKTYRSIRNDYEPRYPSFCDTVSFSKYIVFRDENNCWKQCWYDDAQTLGKKYDYVINMGIGGIGIWALGYDNGYQDLWDMIALKFTGNSPIDTSGPPGFKLNNTDFLLANSKAEGAIDSTNAYSPGFIKSFYHSLERYLSVISLLLFIILVFGIIGFIIAIMDYDVREKVFKNDIKIFLFIILLIAIVLMIFRIFNVIKLPDVIFIAGLIMGIFFFYVITIAFRKRAKRKIEDTP